MCIIVFIVAPFLFLEVPINHSKRNWEHNGSNGSNGSTVLAGRDRRDKHLERGGDGATAVKKA